MVSVLLGTIVEVNGSSMKIKDLISGDVILAEAAADIAFDVHEGEEGVFSGLYQAGGKFVIKRLNVRKFLKPLYEDDLMEASGRETFIQPVDDPFFEAFEKLKDTLYVDRAWEDALKILEEEGAQGVEVQFVDEENGTQDDSDG